MHLQGLRGALLITQLLLAPVLLLQGGWVRRRALALPEAPGPRTGRVGAEGAGQAPLRVLIVGDSSAAGVGAAHQSEALAATVARHLHRVLQRPVCWQLIASTGWTSADAVAALSTLPDQALAPADVWVSVLGVNDVVHQVPGRRTLANLEALRGEVQRRCGARQGVFCAAPPMHRFPLLPLPLRWVLGAQAQLLNRRMFAQLPAGGPCTVLDLPPDLNPMQGLMAADGFHPGPAGYALWGAHLAQHLTRLVAPARSGEPGSAQ